MGEGNKWVTDDLGLKIQTKTDVLIKTVQSPQDTRMLVVTITKNTTWQSGVNEIDFVGNCSSMHPLCCRIPREVRKFPFSS
jgi:hypothetical protein